MPFAIRAWYRDNRFARACSWFDRLATNVELMPVARALGYHSQDA
jgi:hypothetical protein